MFDHQLVQTTSGMPVLLVSLPAVKSATFLVLVNTGSRYENDEKQGIAHFFEHIVFKGTTAYPDAQTLASAIDAIGAEFNAFTSREYTGYYVKCASKHSKKALDVLSDMILRPNLKPDEIDREKGVIIEEINMYRDTPMHHVANLFETMVYRGSGLSHDIIGTKETVSSITREDFVQFLSKWYGPENLVLVVAGDESLIQGEHFLDSIEVAFAKKVEHGRKTGKQAKENLMTMGFMADELLHVENRATEQAHLVMGWPGIARSSEKRHIMSVLSVIMGGNMSSRLFSEVREKRGLCYYVRSDVDYYHETGLFGASAGVDPTRIEEAIKVILAEFQAISDSSKPVSADELQRAKDYLSGTMTLSFEDSRSVGQFYGLRQLLRDSIETPEDVLAKIRTVTADQVQQLAHSLIANKQARLAVIGPFDDPEKFRALLK